MLVECRALPLEINQVDLHAAQAAFFNPDNAHTSFTAFYQALISMVETEAKLISSVNPEIIKALDYVFQNLDPAQKFDEKYLGHMLTESSIPALFAYFMAMRIGSNTVAEEVSSRETQLEPEAIRWMIDLIGYDPEKASGTFTSGGSLANTTALWVARELASERNQNSRTKFVVLVNPFVHYSIDKSIRILCGPYKDSVQLVRLPSKNLAIDPAALVAAIAEVKAQGKEVMAVVAIAGETETGLIDDFNAIADITEENGIYLHADAAYGLPYKMSSRAHLFAGIERANSVTIDPHKALNIPYSAGAVVFRSSQEHSRVQFNAEDAEYVFKEGKASLGQKRIEGSMGAGPILATVAAIRALSTEQWKALLDHSLVNIESLYDRLLVSPVLMPVHEPELNILCFTLRPEFCQAHGIVRNNELKKLINQTAASLWTETGYFFSTTNLPVDSSISCLETKSNHQYVYRAVPMHPRTEQEHLDEAIGMLEQRIMAAVT